MHLCALQLQLSVLVFHPTAVSFLFLTMITVQLQIAIHMLHSEHMQIDELYPLISSRVLMLLVNEICVHQVHEIVIEKYM